MNYQSVAQKTSALAGTTGIGATFVMSSQTEMTAWVTGLTDNADVSGAQITVYLVGQTYQCSPDTITAVGRPTTTGTDGTATLDLSSLSNRYATLVAVISFEGKLAIIRDLPHFNTYTNGGQPDAAVVTDRALCKMPHKSNVASFHMILVLLSVLIESAGLFRQARRYRPRQGLRPRPQVTIVCSLTSATSHFSFLPQPSS